MFDTALAPKREEGAWRPNTGHYAPS